MTTTPLNLSPFINVRRRATRDDHGIWTNAEGVASIKDTSGPRPETTDDGALVPAVTTPHNTIAHTPGDGMVVVTLDYSQAHGVICRIPVIVARTGSDACVWASLATARALAICPGYKVRSQESPAFKAHREAIESAAGAFLPAYSYPSTTRRES